MRTSMFLLAILVVALAACAGDTGDVTVDGGDDVTGDDVTGDDDVIAGDAPLPTGEWLLDAADAGIDVGDSSITLTVTEDPDTGADTYTVDGVAACNSYGGTVLIDEDQLEFGEFMTTEMGCEEPLMSAQITYLDRLLQMSRFEVEFSDDDAQTKESLTLLGDDDALRFTAVAPVDPAALTGTEWVVDTFLSGTGEDGAASSTVAGVPPATFRFDEDGTFTLFTGCRDFVGEWALTEATLQVPSSGEAPDSRGVGPDGELTCDEPAVAQEDAVLVAFESGASLTIDGDRLTLTSRGEGIAATAS